MTTLHDYHHWHETRVASCLAHFAQQLPSNRPLQCLDLGHDPRMGDALRGMGLTLTGNVHPDTPPTDVAWPIARFDFETRFPLEDASFDVVTAFEVIEHVVGSPRAFVQEIFRVLRPGGTLYLGTPNVTSWAKVRRLMMHMHPYDAMPYSLSFGARHPMCHVYEYDPWTLKQLLMQERFEIVECRTWDAYDTDPRGIREWVLRALVSASLAVTGFAKDAAQIWRLRGHQMGLVARKA